MNAKGPLPKRTYQVPFLRGARIRLDPHHRSPDPNNLDEVHRWLSNQSKPWAIDLFCGAGGLSLGLEDGGFSVVAAADSDPVALETHAANIEGLVWTGDLSDPSEFLDRLHLWGIDSVDMVAGGPPCQPFSKPGMAKIGNLVREGSRTTGDERVDLWKSFFSVIDRLTPKAVLIENVPGLAQAQDGAVLTSLVNEFRIRDYSVNVEILEAWKFRVPQHRSRLFIVAFAEDCEFDWPTQIGRKPRLGQAIGDLPNIPAGTREETQAYCGPPKTILAKILRKGLNRKESGLVHDHITRAVRPDDAEIFRLMKPGGTYRDVPIELRRYRSDIFEDRYVRLSEEDVSRSITAHIAKDGYWYIHPTQDRTLSIREAARIQTFPDRFRFAGYQTHRFRQIGNAVPPLLGSAIVSAIRLGLDTGKALAVPRADLAVGNESTLRSDLLHWFKLEGRKFPWRNSNLNAWQVLLIELCLQQKNADHVVRVAREIIDLGRTPEAFLSNASKISPKIASIGIPWQDSDLVRAASFVDSDLEGVVPDTWQGLRAIPGVANYVASAALCFGHHRPTVLMDTNTARTVRRLVGCHPDTPAWHLRLALLGIAGPEGPDQEWNYGLLDLGVLFCTSKSPKCEECPIQRHCSTGMNRGKKGNGR